MRHLGLLAPNQATQQTLLDFYTDGLSALKKLAQQYAVHADCESILAQLWQG